jgi:recombination protein RecA
VTVRKNKVAPPFKVAEFDIMYNEGISTTGDILDLGVEYDILSKRGAYFRFNDEIIGQGREAAKEFLRMNPAIVQEIDALIRAQTGLAPADVSRSSNGHAAAANAVALTV